MISDKTTITNPQHTEFGSDLLNEMSLLALNSRGIECEKETVPNPGKKGEIVTVLIVHLAGDIAYDLLKLALKRLSNHPYYDPLIELNLNGRAVAIEKDV